METKPRSCWMGKRGQNNIGFAGKFKTIVSCRSFQVRAVEKEFRAAQGEEDVKHMKKLLNVSILMYIVGILS